MTHRRLHAYRRDEFLDSHLAVIEYEPCPIHPHIYLQVPTRPAETVFCYQCAQDARKDTFAKQKAETMEAFNAANNR